MAFSHLNSKGSYLYEKQLPVKDLVSGMEEKGSPYYLTPNFVRPIYRKNCLNLYIVMAILKAKTRRTLPLHFLACCSSQGCSFDLLDVQAQLSMERKIKKIKH